MGRARPVGLCEQGEDRLRVARQVDRQCASGVIQRTAPERMFELALDRLNG